MGWCGGLPSGVVLRGISGVKGLYWTPYVYNGFLGGLLEFSMQIDFLVDTTYRTVSCVGEYWLLQMFGNAPAKPQGNLYSYLPEHRKPDRAG